MTLSSVVILGISFAAGVAIGAFYFIALWQTVRRLPQAASPARLMLGSLIVRMAVALGGFYLITGTGQWDRLALAMLGFWVMRKILTLRLGPPAKVALVN